MLVSMLLFKFLILQPLMSGFLPLTQLLLSRFYEVGASLSLNCNLMDSNRHNKRLMQCVEI